MKNYIAPTTPLERSTQTITIDAYKEAMRGLKDSGTDYKNSVDKETRRKFLTSIATETAPAEAERQQAAEQYGEKLESICELNTPEKSLPDLIRELLSFDRAQAEVQIPIRLFLRERLEAGEDLRDLSFPRLFRKFEAEGLNEKYSALFDSIKQQDQMQS